MTTHTEAATSGGAPAPETTAPRLPPRMRWAWYATALWSTSYLVLGLLWQGGDGAYPWDSAQDSRGLNILDGVEQGLVSWLVIGLAVAGLATCACQGCGRTGRAVRWTAPGSASRWGRWATAVAVAICPWRQQLTPTGCAGAVVA